METDAGSLDQIRLCGSRHEVGMGLVGRKAGKFNGGQGKGVLIHDCVAPAPAAGARISGLVASRHLRNVDAASRA